MLLTYGAARWGWLTRLENVTYDIRFAIKDYFSLTALLNRHQEGDEGDVSQQDKRIVFCNIDDAALEELGGQWPLPRKAYLDFLNHQSRAHLILFDILFHEYSESVDIDRQLDELQTSLTEPSGFKRDEAAWRIRKTLAGADDALAQSAAQARNAVFPAFLWEVNASGLAMEQLKSRIRQAHLILLSDPSLYAKWSERPKLARLELAQRLGLETSRVDDQFMDLLEDEDERNLLAKIELFFQGNEEKMLNFLVDEGRDGEILRSFSEFTPVHLKRARGLMQSRETAQALYELHESQPGSSLFDLAKGYLVQDRQLLSDPSLRHLDKALRDLYTQRHLRKIGSGENGLPFSHKIYPPILGLLEASRGLCHVTVTPDPLDGKVRQYNLVIQAGDRLLPSLALSALLLDLGVTMDQVHLDPGRALTLDLPDGSRRVIPIDESGRIYINWQGRWKSTYRHTSFAEASRGKFSLHAKIVFVGMTATGTQDLNPTPLEARVPMVISHANAFNTLSTQNFLIPAGRATSLGCLMGACLFSGLSAYLLSRFWNPLSALAGFAAYIIGSVVTMEQGVILPVAAPLTGGLLSYLLMLAYRTWMETLRLHQEKERTEHLSRTFSSYLNPVVVQEILKDPNNIKLGGQNLEATIFFSDIAGFTSIAETLSTARLVALLNMYLTEMSVEILRHDGFLDKYIGDCIMAGFGIPIATSNHAVQACLAALANQRRAAGLRQKFHLMKAPEIHVRIGIHTGPVICGNMGSEKRLDYTMVGDSVNLASRLEGVNKVYGTGIIISETTARLTEGRFRTRRLDRIRVRGKKEAYDILELRGMADEIPDGEKQFLERFHEGLDRFRDRDWPLAAQHFHAAFALQPTDATCLLYLERCRENTDRPPEANWDGVHEIRSK